MRPQHCLIEYINFRAHLRNFTSNIKILNMYDLGVVITSLITKLGGKAAKDIQL